MDRHIVPGITLADAAEAHNLDVAIQEEYDCKAMTFWLDEERGCAFCLIEAPNREAVHELHDNAHGLIPNEIIEVEEDLVMAFLGRISDPEPSEEDAETVASLFCQPAFRFIMATKLKDALLLESRFGKSRGRELFNIHREIVEHSIVQNDGRKVQHTDDSYMASFTSVSEAIDCAVEVKKEFNRFNEDFSGTELQIAMGLSAGNPVSDTENLFGEAVLLAERLCYLSYNREEILIASEVTEQYGLNRIEALAEAHFIQSLKISDERFLNRLMDTIESVWNQGKVSVNHVSRQMGLSRAQLYRNITSLTGLSFVDFVKEYRLRQALTLIKKYPDNITRVAYDTGFSNPSYFTKCFKEQFGILPSEYAKTVS